MIDTNSTTLRNALATAVKSHVEANGLSAKQAAEAADVQLSRMYLVLRGDVSKVSSDALMNMLGGFGYRLNVQDDAITMYLGGADKVLPEIEKPVAMIEPDQNNADFDPDFDRVVSEDE